MSSRSWGAPHLDRAGIERVVDTLARIHREGGAPTLDEGLGVLGAATFRTEDLYEEARRRIRSQERVLREQSSATGRIIERLRKTDRGPSQQLLRLQAEVGAVAGGRFRLHNDTDRELTLRAAPRSALPVRLEPDPVLLAPGEERTVALEITLDGLGRPGERVNLLIDFLDGEATRAKLWVEIFLLGRVT